MSLKPWREIIVPHPDVLNGTFQQSEFAADITAVRTGKATPEYGDAKAFFERTFITEGMGRLLTQVSQRLNGKGGEPVIQLQTAFGGGKTHTLLAVYHLASRKCPLGELVGIPALLDHAELLDVPQAQIAVLDGTAHAPVSHGSMAIRRFALSGGNWPGSWGRRRALRSSGSRTPTERRLAKTCSARCWVAMRHAWCCSTSWSFTSASSWRANRSAVAPTTAT